MKRDMYLIRAILLAVRDHAEEYVQQESDFQLLKEASPDRKGQVVAHLRLLQEAGFVQVKFHSYFGQKVDDFSHLRLTWEGQEFIADAQDEGIWARAVEKAGDVSLAVLKQTLAAVVKQHLGL